MATRFSNTLLSDNALANFRAWAQFIEDTLVTTGGWVVTGDTGQTTPATLTAPGAANAKQGYRIYRMADTLQGTFPVFMRLDFGSSSAGAVHPGLWVTIGTGSNGSGTITGILWNGGASTTANITSTSAAQANNSYGSANTNRVSLAMFCNPTSSIGIFLCIERSKDANGADTGDGVLVIFSSSNGTLDGNRYLNYTAAGGPQPTAELGLNYVLTTQNPSQTFSPGDVGIGVISQFKGVAQQPGMNVVIVNSADVGAQGSFIAPVYGSNRTYQQCDSKFSVRKTLIGNSTPDSNVRACIRYE